MDPIIVQILGSFNGQRVNFSEWVASTLPLQINEKFSLLTDVVIVAAVSFEVTGCLRIGDNAKEQRAHEESEQQCVAQQIDAGCQDVQCERYRLPLVHPLLRCPLEQLHCRHCTPLSSPQFRSISRVISCIGILCVGICSWSVSRVSSATPIAG